MPPSIMVSFISIWCPARTAASATTARRSSIMLSSTFCSATAPALTPLQLQIKTPFSLAAAASNPLTPTPSDWISRKSGSAKIASPGTGVMGSATMALAPAPAF